MRLINVYTLQLEEFFHGTTPPYAILSHTWSSDNEELSFADFQNGNTRKSVAGSKKLQGCCRIARAAGLGYVWIDTCCIDKTNSVELGEAVNSMFRWYKNSAICYVYLSDVPAGNDPLDQESSFSSSRWFRRGWTLQELLAPSILSFYDSEWGFLGNKRRLSSIIERISGVRRTILLGIESLRDASVAERMSWAANRATKRKEDTAYCLLGIFNVTMPMIYGEGERAFIRLQQAIMMEISDDSILAWGLGLVDTTFDKPADILSAGVLATSPKDFARCGHITQRKHHPESISAMTVVQGHLRLHLPIVTIGARERVGLLSCGPKRDADQVVGIPLGIPTGSSKFVRIQGLYPLLIRPPDCPSPEEIFIAMERQPNELVDSCQNWFYIEPSVDTHLELIEVEPHAGWQRDISLISMTRSDGNDSIEQPTLARFQSKRAERDILIIFGLTTGESQPGAYCHVMIVSKDLDLGRLRQYLAYLRPEAFGRLAANHGAIDIHITIEEETIGLRPMFAVRLHATNAPAEHTDLSIIADFELNYLLQKVELLKQLVQEDKIHWEKQDLAFEKEGA